MELINHGKNQTTIVYKNGSEVFFSYRTPVAGYTPTEGYIKTDKWYSSTTTKHINQYLNGITMVREVSQDAINKLQVN